MTPLIGVTGRRRGAAEVFPADAALLGRVEVDVHFSAYPASVVEAGGLPVQIPPEAAPAGLVGRIDGLILSGGSDVDPALYAADGPSRETDPARDRFELELLETALNHRVPVLAVCRGLQLLNVALGGTLIDLHRHEPGEQSDVHAGHRRSFAERAHRVSFRSATALRDVYGEAIMANSVHRQVVDRVADGLAIGGVADDDVVEAVEHRTLPAVGVQWHPEFHRPLDPIFAWLVDRARESRCSLTRHR